MPPSVTEYFRKNPPSVSAQRYLTDITAQQCSIDEIFHGNKCVSRKTKNKGR